MLILAGVAGRFVLIEYVHIPNFEIVTALSLIAGIYLGGIYAVIVPLSIIFFSDLVIGNSYVFVFTWSAFAFIGIFGWLFKKCIVHHSSKNGKKIYYSPLERGQRGVYETIVLGVASSVFFFIYTNFGWWLLSGMYEYSLLGLSRCYWMAIPFFRNNLIGNIIFVPMFIYVIERYFVAIKNSKSLITNRNEQLQKYRQYN